MGVPGSANFLLAGSQGYRIERSLRFNSADSANCSRTFSSSNRKTWTWSGWLKRSALGTNQVLFSAGSVSGTYHYHIIGFNTDDKLAIVYYPDTTSTTVRTAARYRDPSAWLHIVAVWDTTQATSSDRAVLYVNGQKITAFDTATYSAQNTDGYINSTAYASGVHYVGRFPPSETQYLDGYLTEINFIDGQALTPSSFGETDTVTGVWKPKKYAGTYGTNGFYLNFSDNSGTTSTTLGKDSSGNGNNWTPNNFSVTAGVGNDSMIDTPTPYADGGNGRGNYATWNALNNPAVATFADGNLQVTNSNSDYRGALSTLAIPSSGKWYWEFQLTSTPSGSSIANLGIAPLGVPLSGNQNGYSNSAAWYINASTYWIPGGTSIGASTTSSIFQVAYDAATRNVWLGRDNVWYWGNTTTNNTTGNPGAGSNPSFTLTASEFFAWGFAYVNGFIGNFGQRPFAYTPPSGFVALNTQNLPEPSIKKPGSYMDTLLWTGNGSARTITGLGFSPDLVWIKARQVVNGSNRSNQLFDTVRGADKALSSDRTAAEDTSNGYDNDGAVTAFTSDGFSLTGSPNDPAVNFNSATYVAWCWDESATPGFDIVTYTGTGSNTTVAHSLGVAPKMIIVKNRGGTNTNWRVYHADSNASPASGNLFLNTTQAFFSDATCWNSTAPTSSVFSVGTTTDTNANGNTYVAYLWSEVAGFSKFGSYTGNGSSDGPFVYCGFRPRWVMIKRTDSSANWQIYDTARDATNRMFLELVPNSSAEENSVSLNIGVAIDALSNGFKLRDSDTAGNASGGTYLFAAFAEAPFKYALAR